MCVPLFVSLARLNATDISNSSFVQFQIWDFPGQIDICDPAFDADLIFGGCGAVVFVIDAQDQDAHLTDALSKLSQTVARAYGVNPHITFEVFIHKVDGLPDDHKIGTCHTRTMLARSLSLTHSRTRVTARDTETQRAVQQQAQEDLAENKLDHIHLSFYLTSIYDHSIFEAFSKVVQKLIPQLPTLENLLDMLVSVSTACLLGLSSCLRALNVSRVLTRNDTACHSLSLSLSQNSKIEKAFLIDVVSKIYVATDHIYVDMSIYELCSDMIDVVIDISCIYGYECIRGSRKLASHRLTPPLCVMQHVGGGRRNGVRLGIVGRHSPEQQDGVVLARGQQVLGARGPVARGGL